MAGCRHECAKASWYRGGSPRRALGTRARRATFQAADPSRLRSRCTVPKHVVDGCSRCRDGSCTGRAPGIWQGSLTTLFREPGRSGRPECARRVGTRGGSPRRAWALDHGERLSTGHLAGRSRASTAVSIHTRYRAINLLSPIGCSISIYSAARILLRGVWHSA